MATLPRVAVVVYKYMGHDCVWSGQVQPTYSEGTLEVLNK